LENRAQVFLISGVKKAVNPGQAASMNEKELISQVLKGDSSAIRQLVDHYQPQVLRTAKGYTGNTEDARDITQEVLIQVIRNLNKFSGKSSLSTWIYRITINRSLNFIRDNKKRKNPVSLSYQTDSKEKKVTLDLPDNHHAAGADARVISQDRSLIIHDALNSLPKIQQTAFTLLEYEDLSYKEIAEAMGMSVSSVESLLFRARKNLQKKLWNCYKKST